MRTNIVLDEELVREAMRYSSARSKRQLVEEALRSFVATKAAERQRGSYAERLQALGPALGRLRLRERPTDVLRGDRDRG
jgi:Arc/MetJ family transcription regulator